MENLKNKNQVLTQLLGDGLKGDEDDMWLTLIAFCGYGAHRTAPRQKDGKHGNAYFVNDVTFLNQYEVRPGHEVYGAAAYFNSKYMLTEIQLSHTGKTYKPPADSEYQGVDDDQRASRAEWLHAKWAWKV